VTEEEASKMTSPDKPGSASFTQMTELVLPVHANHMQTMFGGTLSFHSRVYDMVFLHPSHNATP